MGEMSSTDTVLNFYSFELCEHLAYSQNLIKLCILKIWYLNYIKTKQKKQTQRKKILKY